MVENPIKPIGLLGFLIYCFLCHPGTLHALDPRTPISNYIHDVWTTDQGLPQNSTQVIAQTADGYLWLGTQQGLVRFDGLRFTLFDPSSDPSLGMTFISALYKARDGSLWIGGYDGRVYQFRGNTFNVITVPQKLSGNTVNSFFEDDVGSLWLGSNGGGLYRLERGQLGNVVDARGIPGDNVTALCGDSQHGLWVGTQSALYRYHDGTFERAEFTYNHKADSYLPGREDTQAAAKNLSSAAPSRR